MAKRKRLSSVVKTESPAPSAATSTAYIRDVDVLKPIPQNQEDSDVWPTFLIQDAVVYDKDDKPMADVLMVEKRGPFSVRGRLVIDDEDEQRPCLRPQYKQIKDTLILIRNCQKYSIGTSEVDSQPLIWISGHCGWFEINPAPEYVPTFNRMALCVGMFYNVASIYETHASINRASKRPLTLDEIMLKYAVMVGDGACKEDVELRCREFAPFLVDHMRNDSSSEIDWISTLFFKMIEKMAGDAATGSATCPIDYTVGPGLFAASSAQSSRTTHIPTIEPLQPSYSSTAMSPTSNMNPLRSTARSTRSSSRRDSSVDVPARASLPHIAPAPPAPPPSAPPPASAPERAGASSPTSSNYQTKCSRAVAAQSMVDAIERAWENTGYKTSRATIYWQVYYKNRINPHHATADLLHYHSADLVQLLDKSKWQGTGFYQWLQALSTQPWEPKHIDPNNANFLIEPRKVLANPRQKKDDAQPQAQKRQKRPTTTSHPSTPSDNETMMRWPATTSRHSGKQAGLRLSTANKKRTWSDLQQDDEDDVADNSMLGVTTESPYFDDPATTAAGAATTTTNLVHRNNRLGGVGRHHVGRDDEVYGYDDDSNDDDDEEDNDDDDDDNGLGSNAFRVTVKSERIPSTAPQGRNGTWICEKDDCGFIARAADEPEGRKRVQQHLAEHEDHEERIRLTMAESSKGLMPVRHLLDKIIRAGDKSQAKQRVVLPDGRELPPSFKGRVLT